MSFDVSDQGFTAPTGRQIIDALKDELSDRLGYTPDFDRDTFFGALVASVGSLLGDMSEGLQLVYDQRSVQNATGVQLDDLCSLVGVERQEATSSVVDLDLTGTGGTFVPTGSVVEDENGERWVSLEDATIPASDVRFEAENTGPLVGSKWTIRTPVDGWDGASGNDVTLGQERETDAQLLRRRAREFQIGTTGSVLGIRASVSDLDFVDNVLVFDNPSASTQVVQGRILPPHSVAVIVSPDGLVADDREALAQTILVTKPAGIEAYGDETESVALPDGTSVDVSFSYATTTTVNLVITATRTAQADISQADLEAQLDDLVSEFFSALSVGADVVYHRLYSALADIEASDQMDTLALTLDGSPSNVTIGSAEIAQPNVAFS